MTHEEKVKYLRITFNICNFAFNDEQTDLLVRIYDLTVEKKGDTSIRDIFFAKGENKKAFAPPDDKTPIHGTKP